MFARDPEFAGKKRNRHGDYSHTFFRCLHESEVKILFKRQRALGSEYAEREMEEEYARFAFDQLPLQDSEILLGNCPFEPEEKRASSLAYSFERFRFLSKLNNIRIVDDSYSGRRLTPDELAMAITGFGKGAKSITREKLISLCKLPKDTSFAGVSDDSTGEDLARASKGSAFGSATLYKVIGEAAWNHLVQTPAQLDRIAHVLTFREDIERIRQGLETLELEPAVLAALMEGVETGAFAKFSKAGHISTKAARNILPGLVAGKTYDKACKQAGYDHTRQNEAKLANISNPVAKRAVLETLKQVKALIHHLGERPGAVYLEPGRDVGKGAKTRDEIRKGIEKRTKARREARKNFCKLTDKEHCLDQELMRYELWKEQDKYCMYSHPPTCIDVNELCDGEHAVEIDHILPLSRSYDNSWHNKALARVKENRDKKDQTPFEWLGHNRERWHMFEQRVKNMHKNKKIKGFKIRNLTIKDFSDRKKNFSARNLNDMRYAARVAHTEIERIYTPEEAKGGRRKRIWARSGQIIAILRQKWGLERLKYLPDKDGKKKRIEDDRHHAVDAIIVAVCTESQLRQLTEAIQEREEKGLQSIKKLKVDKPWERFTEDVIAARDAAPVARSENRRGRGAGHEATIRKSRIENGKRIIYERKSIEKITRAAPERLKDPDRNKDVYRAVSDWLDAGAPADKLPRRNNGHLIRKVTVRSEKNPTTERSGFEVNNGHVDNGNIVRLDVFEKSGKFYIVPIYVHQIADRAQWPKPPNKATTAGKTEKEWPEMNETYSFRFSLYPFSWVEVAKRDGEIIQGYYRGVDRSTASITLSEEVSRQRQIRGIGCRTLLSFSKFQVDRLGRKSEIKSEKRTWHGVVCT